MHHHVDRESNCEGGCSDVWVEVHSALTVGQEDGDEHGNKHDSQPKVDHRPNGKGKP